MELIWKSKHSLQSHKTVLFLIHWLLYSASYKYTKKDTMFRLVKPFIPCFELLIYIIMIMLS